MAVTKNPNKGKLRETIWGVKASNKIIYAWKGSSDPAKGIAGISDQEVIDELGLINLTEAGVPQGFIAIMGANAPKPPRLTKKGTDGKSVTMFCDHNKYRSALRKGWSSAKRGRVRGMGDSASQIVVTVPIYGLHYCWNAYQDILTVGGGGSGGTLAEFCGIQDASLTLTTDAELSLAVFGTSRPRPAEAQFTVLGGQGSIKKPNLKFFISEEKEADDTLRQFCKSIIPSVPPLG